MEIYGMCDPKFQQVADQFERNFLEHGEVGASVCITLEGETVVDLWGGTANNETQTQWEEDTVSIIWSSTKGATALCAHILSSRGLLDMDAPVVNYWPEFGKAGKENITVKMLLNHQAGVAAIRKPLSHGAFSDWNTMVHALEEEIPFWEPGTRHGYHALTFGWLVGEVVRRVSGKSLGQFFQNEVAKPLGIDFWIGLPKGIEPRVAKMITAETQTDTPFYQAMLEPNSIQSFVFNTGGLMEQFDSRIGHASEIGAANGITNARGLAGMYAPLACGGSLDGVTLVDKGTLMSMSSVSSATGQDAVLLGPKRFTLGYNKSIDNRKLPLGYQDSCILSEDAFGHAGNGGSIGFASPNEKMSFAYTMNKMGAGISINQRGQSLIDATYLSLGYTTNSPGSWIK
ncbi:class A beta-lactamase-related serine hydrolase [Salicibibacter kimchii]|uniref:Class A beta-lactamase-related serine hydrolase n=2 Tax=Salicibibacter kimchii TaxID=2099786 RepID=A0A345BWL0_9BACI|nr:class A beta-lactamase-related serine hydrolase [Salicibibacter kimchii]